MLLFSWRPLRDLECVVTVVGIGVLLFSWGPLRGLELECVVVVVRIGVLLFNWGPLRGLELECMVVVVGEPVPWVWRWVNTAEFAASANAQVGHSF